MPQPDAICRDRTAGGDYLPEKDSCLGLHYLSLTPLARTRQLVRSLDIGAVQKQELEDLKLVAVRRQDDG